MHNIHIPLEMEYRIDLKNTILTDLMYNMVGMY